MDQTRNTVDISTFWSQYYSLIKKKNLATFEATFERPVTSTDTDEDNGLIYKSLNDLIWAYGEESNGSPSYHIDRGTDHFFISGGLVQNMINLIVVAAVSISVLLY